MNMNNESTPNSVSKGPWSSLKVDLGASSHPGHVRENNEDSYLVMRYGRSLETVLTNLEEDLLQRNYAMRGYGILVADGMGGAAGGEVASRFALGKLVDLIIATPDWTLALQRREDVKTVLRRMTERFLEIDDTLRREADRDHTLRGMGTTLTVAGVMGNDLIVGHVGDSRAYILRG